MSEEKFFENKCWELITSQLKEIRESQKSEFVEIRKEQKVQSDTLVDIKSKLNWTKGWAAGIAFVVSIGYAVISFVWPIIQKSAKGLFL